MKKMMMLAFTAIALFATGTTTPAPKDPQQMPFPQCDPCPEPGGSGSNSSGGN